MESTAPSGPRLVIDSLPAVDIGPAAGPMGEFFTSPVTAVRLSDGRIAAVGWATTEFRIFDSTGRWVKTTGRSGAGPGEFEPLGFLLRGPADSLVTFEMGVLRVQRWSPDGDFVSLGQLVPPRGESAGWVMGVFTDGSLLIESSRRDPAKDTDLTLQRVFALRRARTDGSWDTLFTYPGPVQLRKVDDPANTWGEPLFSPAPSYHQRGDRIAYSPGNRFEVVVRDATGRILMIIRNKVETRKIANAEFERAVAGWETRLSAKLRAPMLSGLRRASTSRIRPPISAVWLAGGGRIWAVHGDPNIGEPVTASVFDSLGRWVSDVLLPDGFEIKQIDEDGVLGIVIDASGFRHVRWYRFAGQ